MNTPNPSDTQTDVLAKIDKIEKKSAGDNYLYRGENEHYK